MSQTLVSTQLNHYQAWEISGDRLAETLDLNLKVTFYTSQEFLRRAVERKRGSLVLVGSTGWCAWRAGPCRLRMRYGGNHKRLN